MGEWAYEPQRHPLGSAQEQRLPLRARRQGRARLQPTGLAREAALGACFVNDPFYKAKDGANPFFQSGYENPEGGYILIEFWSSVDKAQKYVDFLNEQWNNNNNNKEG